MPTSEQHTIIDEMTAVAAPGLPELDDATRAELAIRTAQLLSTHDSGEYARYRSIIGRQLDLGLLGADLDRCYRGKRIVVTGGTGCIGSTLLRQLVALAPSELVSLNLPVASLEDVFEPLPGVRYVETDLRDAAATRALVDELRPDVIFHCAAQRSPWLAERQVARTLTSNVLGTNNVLQAARAVDVGLVVHASTGKAMRYYTDDVYAGTKKLAEWLVHDYAREGRAVGMARFTHVVDNAVVVQKVDESLAQPHGVMRVHDPEVFFYAQSAIESAQLLMLAGVQATGDGSLEAVAIRELGDPVDLVQLVLGRIRDRFSTAVGGDAPALYFSGFDRGYERGNPPGLYDPSTAADVSPLINAVEAVDACEVAATPAVDRFPVRLPRTGELSDQLCRRIDEACQRGTVPGMLAELHRASARQADVALGLCPEALFRRLDAMAHRGACQLPTSRVPARAA